MKIDFANIDIYHNENEKKVHEYIYNFSLKDLVNLKLHNFISKLDVISIDSLYDRVIREVEYPLIKLTLEKVNYNQIKASKLLGINRNTLRKKIRELNIPMER